MLRSVSIALVTVVVSAHLVSAQEWPQWRGPARDGAVAGVNVPAAWPAAFERTWRVDVGEGYASPILAAGRIFVHSRKDPKEIVTALDAKTGAVVWQHDYDASYQKNQYAVRMGKGPNATPLAAGGRLFTVGATAVVTAWDAASGRQLWHKNYASSVDLSKLFCGTAASPILANGAVIVQIGSDVHGGRMLALDPASGEQRWEWRGDGPGYASPILITTGGASHIVTLTNRSIVGIDPGTGRELWSTGFANEWHENISSPVWTGTELIASSNQQGTNGYTLARTGGAWKVTPAWKNAEVSMYMSTPVLADGVLYGLSDKRKGSFFALDPKTGRVHWQTEGREGANAALLLTPRHIVYLLDTAGLVVARRDATKFSLEKKYDLPVGATWATPVLLGRDLIVRDATGIARLSGK